MLLIYEFVKLVIICTAEYALQTDYSHHSTFYSALVASSFSVYLQIFQKDFNEILIFLQAVNSTNATTTT